MRTEASCHLVDMTVMRTSVSLTLGYLQAFAEADPRITGRCQFSTQCRSLHSDFEPTWQNIQQLIDNVQPDKHVFGFTNFFWNRKLNLALARRIKTALPEALVVFGGNDVTDQAATLLVNDSPVDVIVNGEGEVAFTNLLAHYLDAGADFHTVKGVSFRDGGNGIVTTAPQPRIEDLDSIPSPFLCGLFSAEALAASVDLAYEFSRGCPFKCAFCYWGAAIGTKTRRFSRDRIRQDLEFIIAHVGPMARIFMADANFGMTDADVETAYLLADLVQTHRKKKIFLVTNWAKNTTKRVIEAATVLYRHGMIRGVTLSAQSLNEEVLRIADRRNIPFQYYRQLQEQFRTLGIPTYTELIFGLPGESYASFLDGAAKVISAGGTPIIHPLILLNNTEYNDPRIRTQYRMISRMMHDIDGLNDADILIGHDRLSYQDWLKGMGLRLVVPLFHCGILKFVMARLHAVHGLGYADMLNRLVEYCMEGRVDSHPLFRRIFLHYIDTWDSSQNIVAPPIDIKETQFGGAHYRTLMKVVLQDTSAAGSLISELSMSLSASISGERSTEFNYWIQYQNLLVKAMSQVAFRGAEEIQTTLEASLLLEYAGCGVAEDIGSCRRLRVRADYSTIFPDEFLARIELGSIDTLKMFGGVEAMRHDRNR